MEIPLEWFVSRLEPFLAALEIPTPCATPAEPE
jgi:hypothetical protein